MCICLWLKPRTKLFQTHRKNTFFPCHPGKNGNRRHINVRFPLLLFQSHESYALPDVGFETKANLNRGWAGFLLFLFRDDGSVRKSQETDGTRSTVLREVCALSRF